MQTDFETLLEKFLAETLAADELNRFLTMAKEPVNDIVLQKVLANKLDNKIYHGLSDRTRIPEMFRATLEKTTTPLLYSPEETGRGRTVRRYMFRRWLKAAAVLIGLLGLGAAYYWYNQPGTTYKTEYGKLEKIWLPDSSLVVLNANSTITYKYTDDHEKPRELWLEGEAFFNVRHINRDSTSILPYERFLVHTTELTIEVLGTSFDIRKRRNTTEIVLQTGKIKIGFNDGTRADIIMKPGDMVIYDPTSRRIDNLVTVPENYVAWTAGRLDLTSTPLRKVCDYLEDNFGYKVILGDPELMKKNIEGFVPLDNLDDALFAISMALHVNIIKKDKTLTIMPK